MLEEPHQKRALDALQNYLSNGGDGESEARLRYYEQSDRDRLNLIKSDLEPLTARFLSGELALPEFKSTVDSLNKRNSYWGFKGMKGQMFFNMLYNAAADSSELEAELRSALALPASEEMARSRITTFVSYVKRVGEDHVAAGNTKHGCPKLSSIPYFLSYFWQLQQPEVWPIFYTNSVNSLQDLNIWKQPERLADSYIEFKHVHEALQALFSSKLGKSVTHYDVEHVLAFDLRSKAANRPDQVAKPLGDAGLGRDPRGKSASPTEEIAQSGDGYPAPNTAIKMLPESYVPPVVEVLSRLALHDPAIEEAARVSGLSVERALEKTVHAAFTVLGYHTELLGQGKGRVPDGRAEEPDHSYIIIWDAKVRSDGYSMGTDDRTIREYIATQSRELRRRRATRNLYYVVVSSRFRDDYDDAIRGLKMDTDISEVVLLESDALVEMVNQRLRNPLEVSLGPDGLQRMFSSSGIVTSDDVRLQFGT